MNCAIEHGLTVLHIKYIKSQLLTPGRRDDGAICRTIYLYNG